MSERTHPRRNPAALSLALIAALASYWLAVTSEAADTFTDDDDSVHETDIEWIAAAEITQGCNPPINDHFCPDDPVTRGQIAAFLTRALDLTTPDTDPFTDDDTSVFEPDIEALASAGITLGCNPPTNDRFCPDDPVTRGQMAAFLTRALDLTTPDADPFTDDDTSVFESDIEALASAGITLGCNPPTNDRFCPEDPVTREQMASFLRRALDDTIPPPTTGSTSTSTPTTTPGTGTSTTTTVPPPPGNAEWMEVPDGSGPRARHEAGFVAVGDRLYLLGGRGTRVIQYFDTATGSWVNTGASTTNLHHFQPVVIGTDIYIVGALTGQCCDADEEPPATAVMVFDTVDQDLTTTHAIPSHYQRGAAGAVVYQGDIYIVSGNSGGHGDTDGSDGSITENVAQVTRYDPDAPPASRWTALAPIPHPRDHFQAVVVGDELWVVGGRTSEVGPFGNPTFEAVVPQVDVYDFDTNSWSTPTSLPAARAASATATIGGGIYVIGGEGGDDSVPGEDAKDRVDRYAVGQADWDVLPVIPVARHGTGGAVCGDDIYVAAGATTRGGSSETNAFHALDTSGDGFDCLP